MDLLIQNPASDVLFSKTRRLNNKRNKAKINEVRVAALKKKENSIDHPMTHSGNRPDFETRSSPLPDPLTGRRTPVHPSPSLIGASEAEGQNTRRREMISVSPRKGPSISRPGIRRADSRNGSGQRRRRAGVPETATPLPLKTGSDALFLPALLGLGCRRGYSRRQLT